MADFHFFLNLKTVLEKIYMTEMTLFCLERIVRRPWIQFSSIITTWLNIQDGCLRCLCCMILCAQPLCIKQDWSDLVHWYSSLGWKYLDYCKVITFQNGGNFKMAAIENPHTLKPCCVYMVLFQMLGVLHVYLSCFCVYNIAWFLESGGPFKVVA